MVRPVIIGALSAFALLGCVRFYDDPIRLPPASRLAAMIPGAEAEVDVFPSGSGTFEFVAKAVPVTVKVLPRNWWESSCPCAGVLIATYSLAWRPQDGPEDPKLVSPRVPVKPLIYLQTPPSSELTEATFPISLLQGNIGERLIEIVSAVPVGTSMPFLCRINFFGEDDNYMMTETSAEVLVRLSLKASPSP